MRQARSQVGSKGQRPPSIFLVFLGLFLQYCLCSPYLYAVNRQIGMRSAISGDLGILCQMFLVPNVSSRPCIGPRERTS